MPLPIPIAILPTINCANGRDPGILVTWIITPSSIITEPRTMALRRPRRSPTARMNIAPAKQPTSYIAVTSPCMVASFVSVKVSLKAGAVMMPLMTLGGISQRRQDNIAIGGDTHP